MSESQLSNQPDITSPPWQSGTRLVAAILLIALAGVALFWLHQLLVPLILAWLLAFLLHPLAAIMPGAVLYVLPPWIAYIAFTAFSVFAALGLYLLFARLAPNSLWMYERAIEMASDDRCVESVRM